MTLCKIYNLRLGFSKSDTRKTTTTDLQLQEEDLVLSFKPLKSSSDPVRIRAHRKQELITRLKLLKQNYEQNSREIHTTERILNGVISTELRTEILNNKKFEVLKDEKLTSHFVSLTKIKGEDVTISDICDENETIFVNSTAHSAYIKTFLGIFTKNKTITFYLKIAFRIFWGIPQIMKK
jgi:hypothetical protein